MNPATHTPSIKGRIRTVALAATIALGTLFPAISAVQAQDSGFTLSSDVTTLAGLTAMVSGSNNGLNLRTEPAHGSAVIETLADGTVVDLLIDRLDTVRDPDGTTRWWPVAVDGVEGWVSGFYLADSGSVAAGDVGDESSTPDPESETGVSSGVSFSFDGGSMIGATARIAGAGESVNLRSEPTTASDLVTTLSDGAIVSLRIDETDTVVEGDTRWWPVAADGNTGWVSGFFLTADDGSTSASSETASTTTTTTTTTSGAFAAGSYVQAYTGDGDGVNLRADFAPDGALLETLGEGTVLQVMEGPLGFDNSEAGWFKVTTGDLTGYIDGDLLRAASQPESTSDSATTTSFIPGDYAKVVTLTQAGGRIRAGASPDSEKTGFVPESGVVRILSGPASFDTSDRGWFEISYDDQTGYIDGDLLTKTEAPVVETPEPEETPVPADNAANGSFAAGEAVVTNSHTGVGVNVRTEPGRASDRIGFLADASALEIVDGPRPDAEGDNWYHVSNGSVEGWIAGNLLDRATDAPTSPPSPKTARFIKPLDKYTLTQNFGCSSLGYYSYNAAYGCNIHDGTDLATSAGSEIHASGDGTVVFSGWCDCGLGYYVEIDHGDGIHTVYGHQQVQPPVSVGQVVTQGEVIGYVGSTGLSTGPHVHFMFRVNGTAVNARDYVDL